VCRSLLCGTPQSAIYSLKVLLGAARSIEVVVKMWRLLSVLTLCGMPVLRADVCGGLPTGDPKALSFWGAKDKLPPPASFQLSVKRGGPAFRITVRPLAFDLKGNGIAVHAGDIEVARCRDGKQLQVLPILAWQPIDFGASFHADDINFDGYLDFSVLTEFGSKFASRSYWVYDPGSGLFIENELTRNLGENCLGSEWHRGCLKATQIAFDQNKREIRADYIPLFAVCAPNGYRGDRYRVKDNRLILVHKEELTSDNCTLTFSDLVGGTMRVTEIWRFEPHVPPPAPPPSPSPDVQSRNSRRPAPPVRGDLLYQRPLDDQQEGVSSNTNTDGKHQQVGADRFVMSKAVIVTAVRWYGYRCPDPGISQAFDIRFFLDQEGLPAGEPIYSTQAQARISETKAKIRDTEVYIYTAEDLPPFSIPAGRRTWLAISQGSANCYFLWNRSGSVDGEGGVVGIDNAGENRRFSNWLHLKDHLAFALYGPKSGTEH